MDGWSAPKGTPFGVYHSAMKMEKITISQFMCMFALTPLVNFFLKKHLAFGGQKI